MRAIAKAPVPQFGRPDGALAGGGTHGRAARAGGGGDRGGTGRRKPGEAGFSEWPGPHTRQDAICGGEGRDVIDGGTENDTLYAGNCILQETGLFFVDTVRGGDGRDTAYVMRREVDGDFIPDPDVETIRDLRENRDVDDPVDCELTWSRVMKW